MRHIPGSTKLVRPVALALCLTAIAVASTGPAGATSRPPACAGQQWFLGESTYVEPLFNCDRRIQSFRVHTSKAMAPQPVYADVLRNGVLEPAPQGFTCSMTGSHSFTCSGRANARRVAEPQSIAMHSNACAGTALKTRVTVGTGPSDSSGRPTGRTATFSLGRLRACRIRIPKGHACGGMQFFDGEDLDAYFSCNRRVRSFRARTSKSTLGLYESFLTHNGSTEPAPQGFTCPAHAYNSFTPTRASSCGGRANARTLITGGIESTNGVNLCSSVTTKVTAGSGPLDASSHPTGHRVTVALGHLYGCSVPIR